LRQLKYKSDLVANRWADDLRRSTGEIAAAAHLIPVEKLVLVDELD